MDLAQSIERVGESLRVLRHQEANYKSIVATFQTEGFYAANQDGAADAVEALYASGVAQDAANTHHELWTSLESKVINSYFAYIPDKYRRPLTLQAVKGANMLDHAVGAVVTIVGDVQHYHIGLGARNSVVTHDGLVGCIGNSSRNSLFIQRGDVTHSIGAGAVNSIFKVDGFAHDLGSFADGSFFVANGDVDYLLRNAKRSSAEVSGDVRNAALGQSNKCRANVQGTLMSSLGNHAMDARVYARGGVLGKVYLDGATVQPEPLVIA